MAMAAAPTSLPQYHGLRIAVNQAHRPAPTSRMALSSSHFIALRIACRNPSGIATVALIAMVFSLIT